MAPRWRFPIKLANEEARERVLLEAVEYLRQYMGAYTGCATEREYRAVVRELRVVAERRIRMGAESYRHVQHPIAKVFRLFPGAQP